jgi:hypothetical protein
MTMPFAARTKAVTCTIRSALLLGGLIVCGFSAITAGAKPAAHPIHAEGLHVTVLDSASGRPLPHFEVRIDSKNRIRCIRAPCPTNAVHWTGRADEKGVIAVPAGVVQSSMSISAAGHTHAKNLVHDASKTTPHDWVIALDPDR